MLFFFSYMYWDQLHVARDILLIRKECDSELVDRYTVEERLSPVAGIPAGSLLHVLH